MVQFRIKELLITDVFSAFQCRMKSVCLHTHVTEHDKQTGEIKQMTCSESLEHFSHIHLSCINRRPTIINRELFNILLKKLEAHYTVDIQ